MPVVYNLTTLSNRLTQVVNAIDAGVTNGNMRLLASGGGVISTFQLSRPCGVVSGNTLTFNGLSLIDPAAAASATAIASRVEDGDGNIIVSGLTVGTGSTSDIVMTPTNAIIAGQTVALTAATITGD